jgi:hypothetical protein
MPMTYPEERTARLNMRIGPDAFALIREAAIAQRQDITGFVLGAAMDRARAIVRYERALRASARPAPLGWSNPSGADPSGADPSGADPSGGDSDGEDAPFGPELRQMASESAQLLRARQW